MKKQGCMALQQIPGTVCIYVTAIVVPLQGLQVSCVYMAPCHFPNTRHKSAAAVRQMQ